MSERPTPEQIERWRYLLAVRAGEAAALLHDSVAAEDLHTHAVAVSLLAEVDALTKQAEEREADMHSRVRAGYDATIADCWRAKVAEVEAREAAAIARAVAAEQRAEAAELAMVRLRIAAAKCIHIAVVPYSDEGNAAMKAWDEARNGTPTDLAEAHRLSIIEDWKSANGYDDLLRAYSEAIDRGEVAEAQRRELRAEGMEEARALVNAELQTEAVSRDRAYAAGRTEVGSHRQACVEALESATHRIDTRAAELRGPK